MGGLLSKSKTPKSKDPEWQGIGPNTPLPGSSSNANNSNGFNQPGTSNYDRFGNGPQRSTLAQIDNNTTQNNKNSKNSAKANKTSSKILVLLKLDPKAKSGQRRVITKNLISLPSDFRVSETNRHWNLLFFFVIIAKKKFPLN